MYPAPSIALQGQCPSPPHNTVHGQQIAASNVQTWHSGLCVVSSTGIVMPMAGSKTIDPFNTTLGKPVGPQSLTYTLTVVPPPDFVVESGNPISIVDTVPVPLNVPGEPTKVPLPTNVPTP